MANRIASTLIRPLAAMLAVGLLSIAGAGSAAESEVCVMAPDFEVATIDDSRVSLAQLKGRRPLYLKFWLSTCPQCIAEMPHFVHTHEQYGDSIEVVAVNLAIDETMQAVNKALSDHGLEMPVVFDESGEMQSKFDVFGTPTHIVIDAQGRIVHFGHAADGTLDVALKSVQREAH